MSNQLRKHKCRAKCARLSVKYDNRKIICFGCNDWFYAQCFNLNLDAINQKSHFKSDSHVQFLCSTCYEMLHQLIITRRTDNASHHQLAKAKTGSRSCSTDKVIDCTNNDAITSNTAAPPVINNETLQLHESVKLLIDKITTQAPSPSTNCAVCPDLEMKLNNIYSMLIKATDKIDKVHTHAAEKENIGVVTSLIEKLSKSNDGMISTPNKLNNLLDANRLSDWSMTGDHNNDSIVASGRPSLILHQSIDDDILNILRNSEARNWDALDQITRDLKTQSSKIESLLRHYNSHSVSAAWEELFERMDSQNEKLNKVLQSAESHIVAPIASPLVDAIHDMSPLSNRIIDDALSTGNPSIIDIAEKEAMTHYQQNTNENAETSNTERQKMQMHNLSDGGPGIVQASTVVSAVADQTSIIHGVESGNNGLVDIDAGESSSQQRQLEEQVLRLMTNFDTPAGSEQTLESHINRARRELYVSKFGVHFTSEDIVSYLQHNGLSDLSNTRVIRLTKRDQDMSLLSFVSFKIETDEDTAILLLQPDFWPLTCSAVDFVSKPHKPKNSANICTSLSLHPASNASSSVVARGGSSSTHEYGAQTHEDFLLQRGLHHQRK